MVYYPPLCPKHCILISYFQFHAKLHENSCFRSCIILKADVNTVYILVNYLLTRRILSLQLNKQYISGRHVSLSICLFVWHAERYMHLHHAMPCQQHHHNVLFFFKLVYKGLCHGSISCHFTKSLIYLSDTFHPYLFYFTLLFFVVRQGTNVMSLFPHWSMQVCWAAIPIATASVGRLKAH